MSPPEIISSPNDETPPYSAQPTPKPTPPTAEIEPFKIFSEPHELFPDEPIPEEAEPPTADRDPPETAWIVMFEDNEQSRPEEVRLDEDKREAPLKINWTVLPEMVTAELEVITTSVNTRVIFAFKT
jgi:hypothetical protein